MQMQMQIALQSCRPENTRLRSQTACAPEALGRIQSLRAFRRAWDVGLRALGQGTSRNMAWGSCIEAVFWEGRREGGGSLGAPWAALGGVLEASWSLGRLRGRFQRPMGRSWRPLGALLEGFRAEKKYSWTALGRSKRSSKRDFSHLGGQKAPQMQGKIGYKMLS